MTFQDLLAINIIEWGDYAISVRDLFFTLIIVVVTVIVLRLIRFLLTRSSRKRNLNSGSTWSVYQLIRYFVWVIVIVLILQSYGLEISVLVAGFAALLVGIGFGIQHIFSDYISGILILFERSLQVGDVMQLEDGTVGRVIYIGLRTSKMKTRDDVIFIVPNTKLVTDKIINWSIIDHKTRFFVQVGVAYGSDVKLVKEVLLKCAADNEKIANDPSPFVRFFDFGDSSLVFQLFFWSTQSFEVEHIKSDLRYIIDEEFRKNSIRIPFPQRDLHIKR